MKARMRKQIVKYFLYQSAPLPTIQKGGCATLSVASLLILLSIQSIEACAHRNDINALISLPIH